VLESRHTWKIITCRAGGLIETARRNRASGSAPNRESPRILDHFAV
jgi:hypothetical protein